MQGEARYAFELDGRRHHWHEPRIDGLRIREAGGLAPPDEYVLIEMRHHATTSVGLDEPVHLNEREPILLRSFRSDRILTFTVDGRGYEWGGGAITEAEIRLCARIPDEDELVLEGPHGGVVPRGGTVDLSERGVERLVTRSAEPTQVGIVVNARRFEVAAGRITFEALVAIAFPAPPTGPGVSFTVLFRKGPHERPEGSLVAGQSIPITNGEVFNVRYTDKS